MVTVLVGILVGIFILVFLIRVLRSVLVRILISVSVLVLIRIFGLFSLYFKFSFRFGCSGCLCYGTLCGNFFFWRSNALSFFLLRTSVFSLLCSFSYWRFCIFCRFLLCRFGACFCIFKRNLGGNLCGFLNLLFGSWFFGSRFFGCRSWFFFRIHGSFGGIEILFCNLRVGSLKIQDCKDFIIICAVLSKFNAQILGDFSQLQFGF